MRGKEVVLLSLLSGAFFGFLLISGCKHEPDVFFSNKPIVSNQCNSDTVYFQNDILPLLNSSCGTAGCHDAQTGKEGIVLVDYNSVMKTGGINTEFPESSEIYKALTDDGDDRMPPSPYSGWSSEQIAMLYKWIDQGAINNQCNEDAQECDTGNITFYKDVLPVFETNCTGCHNASNPSGGIDLLNFENLAVIIDNGSLLGSVNFVAGYSAMPKGGNKLSNCDIAKITSWVNDTTLFPSNGDNHDCDPDTTYFKNEVLPLLVSNCATSGCHDQASHKEGVILVDYASIIETGEVKPFNPNDSKLYKVLFGDDLRDDLMPPPPASPFNNEQKEIIKNWILQGALNNFCDDCDTTDVTFSGSVWPMISLSCTGCHTGSGAGGGVLLTNYNQVVASADNGSLLGTLRHEAGYAPMPKNSEKFTDCKIETIKIWIDNGTPDN